MITLIHSFICFLVIIAFGKTHISATFTAESKYMVYSFYIFWLFVKTLIDRCTTVKIEN